MAISNHERVGKALEFLKAGLGPFVDREVKEAIKSRRLDAHRMKGYIDDPALADRPMVDWDVANLLKLMWECWNDVFRSVLGPAERGLVGELRGHRNRWAHQETFSGDDAYRALDSAGRLLTAVSAPQSEDLDRLKMELLRIRFDEQARGERRKQAGAAINPGVTAVKLRPWREVVKPHPDVASGRYQQAEFAADLGQVHRGEGSDEYRNPEEFFRRTYLTESLRGLLVGAIQRLSSDGGDPVIQLQTNFGGGKTHSMLALYHLFSGAGAETLPGVETVVKEAKVAKLPRANRVVLVGTKISAGNSTLKDDGTIVRTLWGELAWQLGGSSAYARIAADDERATNPGDVLRELFEEYGPCLILIDEWVAYARQLHDQSDLPAGSFETQFTFAQTLTESARLAGNCLLAISLPASDTAVSSDAGADDVEVGGERGRAALDRLRNVVGRVESSWRPASAEEGFEIVQRRLFEPFSDSAQFKDRDVVARAFADFYRGEHQEFPPECRDGDYEKRIKAAYPIHPEIFDRLYTDWSTLVKFQRTRGVLRLMAAVIHSLWEKGDQNPLILPANIMIDDPRVQSELTRYLSDNWAPIIEKDVDGPNSLPLRIDGEVSNLGQVSACRRVARTIYMGSAPIVGGAHRGIEERRIKLGSVLPGESPALFGDALRRLAGAATYLYQDGPHYWYDTQPTVTKLAEDLAEQIKREPDTVGQALGRRLRDALANAGDFSRVHVLPQSGHDVPDDLDARLVVLGADHPYGKEPESAAEAAAKAILEMRGNSPRLFRNTLVFLAADKIRLPELKAAVSYQLAWESILRQREQLDLSPHQVRQAEAQTEAATNTVTARLPETWQWLLVPVQAAPDDPVGWQAARLSGRDALAVRAGKRLRNEELLVTALASTRLRMELDQIPLWRGDHVAVGEIVRHFATYPYLPRLSRPEVLLQAISDGVVLLTWERDAFAFADSYDDQERRYRGLRGGQLIELTAPDSPGLLVKPEIARRQLVAESKAVTPHPTGHADADASSEADSDHGNNTESETTLAPSAPWPRRYHGTVPLDAARVGRDASQVADEVIAHLAGQVGARVTVTLEIDAEMPVGASDQVVRIVTENGRTLKFSNQGFEKD